MTLTERLPELAFAPSPFKACCCHACWVPSKQTALKTPANTTGSRLPLTEQTAIQKEMLRQGVLTQATAGRNRESTGGEMLTFASGQSIFYP